MANDNGNGLGNRKTPIQDDEWEAFWQELSELREAQIKTDKLWLMFGPLHAIVSSWKWLGAIGAALVYLNQPELIEVFRNVVGTFQ